MPDVKQPMQSKELIEQLFKYGLGEHLVLHVREGKSVLGKIVYDKHQLLLKDHGLLNGLKAENLKDCWGKGLLGMVCTPKGKEWESLTFYGLENCDLPINLESTRHDWLRAAQNHYGDRLIDFSGSVYRGFSLMLDNHFLPVILLHRTRAKSGEVGLAVTDLRSAPMPISKIQEIHDLVREDIDVRMSLNVEDTDLDMQDFTKLFGQFLTGTT